MPGRQILLVEDEDAFAEALTIHLTEVADPSWSVMRTGTLQEALAWLDSHTPTVILLDLNLPDSKELATFERTWAAAGTIPIVVITGLIGAHLEGNVLAKGGVWYLDKMWLASHMELFLSRLETFAEGALHLC